MITTQKEFFDKIFQKDDLVNITLLPDTGDAHILSDYYLAKDIKKSIRTNTTQGAFFCPNPLKDDTRSVENVAALNCLFIDIDSGNPDFSTLPTPHFILKRKADHFHAYWLLAREENNKENLLLYKEICEILIDRLNADKAVKSPAGLIRIPYTEQKKKGEGGHYEIITDNTELFRYRLKDLLGQLKPGKLQKDTKKSVKRGGLEDSEIKDFLSAQYQKTGKRAKGDGRSRFLFFVGLDCHKWGIPEDDAVIFATGLNEKLCDPPETESVLRHQIGSGYKYSREEFGSRRTEAEKGDTDEEINKYKNIVRLRNILRDWVFISSIDRLYNLVTGMELTTITQIDNYIAYIGATDIRFRGVLKHQIIRVVDKIDFRPDIRKRIFKDNIGSRTLNRFSRLKIYEDNDNRQDTEAIRIFNEHLKYLSTTEYEYNTLKNYMAYIVQNPGEKLPYAVLIISKYQGIGKSIMENLFRNMFLSVTGISYVGALENEQLNGNYTHFLADRIICFVHELSQGDKYGIMNRFKNLITETTVEINAKYAKPYTIKNTVNFLMFSNDPGAIKIDKNDRRLFVIYNDKPPNSSSYYDELYKIFTEYFLDIFNYLISVDLSDYNAHERPLMTHGKSQLIEQSESELALYLDELRIDKEGPFEEDIILINDIRDHAEIQAPNIVKGKVSAKAIKMYLILNDYIGTPMYVRINGKSHNKTFWHLPDYEITQQKVKEFLLKKESTD